MPLESLKPLDIVSIVQPGDILAFSGKGNIISDLVRIATNSIVSHVGIVLNAPSFEGSSASQSTDGSTTPPTVTQPKIIESTSLGGFSGVTVTDLITRCTYYPGLIWYLPLRPDLQKKVDSKKLEYWLLQQKGKQYDTWGAVESALLQWEESDYWRKFTSYWPSLTSESKTPAQIPHWFCSELASAALQQVDVLPSTLNPDLIRPTDLVGMQIYSGTYYQIKPPVGGSSASGDSVTPIPEYNSSPLESEAIFQKALVSKKPDVISEIAQAFKGLGALDKAEALYQRAHILNGVKLLVMSAVALVLFIIF